MALLALATVPGCSLLEPEPLDPPAVSLRNLEPEAFGLNSQVFRARLGLFNPNTVPLKISSGEIELELAGVGAAKGRTLAPFEVPAGAEVETDIRITTNLLRDGPALLRALTAGSASEGIDYELSGVVYVERRGPDRVPIRAKGHLALPAPMDPPPVRAGPATAL
jgi:LEA14-like dessication related protein